MDEPNITTPAAGKKNGSKDAEQIKQELKTTTQKLHSKFHKLNEKFDNQKEIGNRSRSSSVSSSISTGINDKVIKVKINRIRMKLAKMSTKGNDALKIGGEDYKRSRANAEKIAVTSQYKRSTSISVSVVSSQSGETLEEKGKPRKRTRGRRGRRGGKKDKPDPQKNLEDLYDLHTDELNLNSETLLILDLLSLREEDREGFLINLAKLRNILIENPKTKSLVLNPRIEKLKDIVHEGNVVRTFDEASKQRIQDITNKIQESAQPIKYKPVSISEQYKKEKPKQDFVTLVNEVVGEGLNDKKKPLFTFEISKKQQKINNYFCKGEFNEKLEEFAQKCVNANLGVIVEGEIRINAKNNDQAFIKQAGEKDAIFTSQLLRKCALQGDIVRAFIRTLVTEPKETDRKVTVNPDIVESTDIVPERSFKGFVIKIVKEVHNRKFVGCFLSYRKNADYITFIPRDMKIPNIKIFKADWPDTFIEGKMENITDVLYVGKIVRWNNGCPVGRILHPIGKCDQLESENFAILLQNNLDVTPYDDEINEMFYGPIIITKSDCKNREDIRNECVFTIDPLTARDLDDAVSCKLYPDGNYEIGVHISDVAHFLQEGSKLDNIVKQRTTSIYLVQEVFHMLPISLCLKCSLLPGENKFAFSVFWKMTPNGEILNTRFRRTIINSCTQLAYEHAQKVIDNPDKIFSEDDFPMIHNGFKASDIVERIKQLNSIATLLRKKRFDNGTLKINRPKLYFDLHPETGEPINYSVAEMNTANYLIEEFMLLANQSVAKFINSKFPETSILRNHLEPHGNMLLKLKDRLKGAGLNVDISSSKDLYESMVKLINESEHKDAMDVCLSHLLSKSMIRARYFCNGIEQDLWHYALSIPIYTHFTSPIRRYPDILVHRLLSAALKHSPPPNRTPDELFAIAEKCNEKKYSAKLAGDDSANLYFRHYIKSKKTVIFRAAIVELFHHSMEVLLIDSGHLIRIPYPEENKVKAKIVLNGKIPPLSGQLILTDQPNSEPVELKMFSEIEIEVYVVKNKLKGRFAIPKCEGAEISDDEVEDHRDQKMQSTEIDKSPKFEENSEHMSEISNNNSASESESLVLPIATTSNEAATGNVQMGVLTLATELMCEENNDSSTTSENASPKSTLSEISDSGAMNFTDPAILAVVVDKTTTETMSSLDAAKNPPSMTSTFDTTENALKRSLEKFEESRSSQNSATSTPQKIQFSTVGEAFSLIEQQLNEKEDKLSQSSVSSKQEVPHTNMPEISQRCEPTVSNTAQQNMLHLHDNTSLPTHNLPNATSRRSSSSSSTGNKKTPNVCASQ